MSYFKSWLKMPRYEYLLECSVCGDREWYHIDLPDYLKKNHSVIIRGLMTSDTVYYDFRQRIWRCKGTLQLVAMQKAER